MKRFILIVLLLFSCNNQPKEISNTDKIKNSYFLINDKMNIGEILAFMCNDHKWETVTTKSGKKYIIFTGSITKDLRDILVADLKPPIKGYYFSQNAKYLKLIKSSSPNKVKKQLQKEFADKYSTVGEEVKVEWLVGKEVEWDSYSCSVWEEHRFDKVIKLVIKNRELK